MALKMMNINKFKPSSPRLSQHQRRRNITHVRRKKSEYYYTITEYHHMRYIQNMIIPMEIELRISKLI